VIVDVRFVFVEFVVFVQR